MAGNDFYPRGIRRYRAGDGVVRFRVRHVLGRHDDLLVHERGAGDGGLGTANDNAVRTAFDDAGVQVRVDLIVRLLGTVALGVGHT